MASIGAAEHSQKSDLWSSSECIERPLKILFLGAGSFFFQNLLVDVLNMPGADRGQMIIIDIDPKRLALAEGLGKKILDTMNKSGWQLTADTDRRKHLAGADYIINCIEVSGIDCVRFDYEIPLSFGVDQCIGDTLGPGGLFKALRTAPEWLRLLKEVEQECPDAFVLNYTNPMSILCLAAARSSNAKVYGLCHSVQGTSHQLADYLGMPYEQLDWQCAGINHLAWFTTLRKVHGEDLYPHLRRIAIEKQDIYEKDPVRFDMMLHFGYFITESSGHLSEYLPYYRKRKELIGRYCRSDYRGESGFYSRNWPSWRIYHDNLRQKIIDGQEPLSTDRTWEYASYIIQAIETNRPFVFHATVPNKGLITNLPQDGVVEVACVADRNGIHPMVYGALPSACAAICDWNMRFIDLAAGACVEKSLEAAKLALMLDPLTAAVCCPAEISKMFDLLVDSQKEFLKEYSN